jgi:hypothetical protein
VPRGAETEAALSLAGLAKQAEGEFLDNFLKVGRRRRRRMMMGFGVMKMRMIGVGS